MYPVRLRDFTTLLASVMTVALMAAALPAQAAGPAGAGAVATSVKELNERLHANTVTEVRRGGRGFRGHGFRGRSMGRLHRSGGFRGHGFRGRSMGRLHRGHVRSYRRSYRGGHSRRYRYYSHRRYYRPRIYYSGPYVYGYSSRSRYGSRCYRPCRYSGHSRSYCRRYCRRHRSW